ncbi:phage holin family protein [soil metagenome]
MNFILTLLISAGAVLLSAYLLPGVHVAGFLTAIVVAAVLALFNAILKPILIILTIPITILTLGLFLLVINALIILLTDFFIAGFVVDGFWWALFFSLILSIVTYVFESLVGRRV